MAGKGNCEMPDFKMSDDDAWKIMQENRIIAVVGLSSNPEKPGHYVPAYLQQHGYKIYPVNPVTKEKQALGEKVYASLQEIPGSIDVVEIFRPSDEVPKITEEAIRKGAKVIWMQTGIVHNQAAEKAEKSGLKVVMNKCMMALHQSKNV